MKDNLKNRYAFSPKSEVSILSDGSGLAIYDGYSCDTHFIHSKTEEGTKLSSAPPELTVSFLVEEFSLSERSARHAIEQLVKQKVLWEVS